MTVWSFIGAVFVNYIAFALVVAYVVGDVLPKNVFDNGRWWRLVISALVYVTLQAGVSMRS